MKDAPLDLSLVIACYNEGEHLEEDIPRLLETLDALRLSYEIIFVDDMSRDHTRELILAALKKFPDKPLRHIFHEKNRGRGAAVCTGFRAARGTVAGYVDADLEVGPENILPCYLAVRRGDDVVVGHRIYRIYWYSLFRHFLSRGYAAIALTILGLPYHDTESGFKFFRRGALLELMKEATDPGWFWDTQVMAIAHRKGLKVREIPCLFQKRWGKTSTVKPFSDALVYLRRLCNFKWG